MIPDLSSFNSPQMLWLLVLVPVFVAWTWVEKKKRAVLRFSAASQLFKQGRGVRPFMLWVLPTLRIGAFVFAVIALARPQERDSRIKDLSVEGIDIMIALDLSTSMEAADFRPNNRLHVAKEVLTEFLAGALERSHRPRGVLGRGLHAGAAHARLRRAQGSHQAAAHPGAGRRHGDR